MPTGCPPTPPKNKDFPLTALAVVGVLGVSFVVSYTATSGFPSGKPFTAQSVTKCFSKEGDEGLVEVRHTTYARKSDGSWVESQEIVSPQGESGKMTEIWDATSRSFIALEPFTRSSTTYYYTESEVQNSDVPGLESCPSAVNSPAAEHAQMLGYDVVKVVEESAGPHGSEETMVAWVAPELGCYSLRRSESGLHGSHNEIQVTSVTEGEPPAEMFEVPAEYVERSPSQLSDEWEAKFGERFWGANEDITKRMDQRYHAHQRKSEDVPR